MGIPDEVPRPEDRAGEAQIALAGDSPPACLVPAGLPVLRLWQSNPSRLVEQTPENLKRKAGREMDSVAGSKAGRESQGENQMTHTPCFPQRLIHACLASWKPHWYLLLRAALQGCLKP